MLMDVLNTFITAIPKELASYTLEDDHDNPTLRKRERSFGDKKLHIKKSDRKVNTDTDKFEDPIYEFRFTKIA